MTEQQKEQQSHPSIVEIEWEEVEKIWNLREFLAASEEEFKSVCLQYEKIKTNLMSRIVQSQNAMYSAAETLRQSKAISSDDTYELKLPEVKEEKAYFIRKES